MSFSIQPTLQNENVLLQPLQQADFEALYQIASDQKVWEQHPNKKRYQRDVFTVYFEGAIQSKGAFLIKDKHTNEIIGSSRYYDFNEKDKSILIGYTFIGTKYWGKKINAQIKKMMLTYIFQFVDKVYFHIGAKNKRSQIAIENIGATKIREFNVAYFGEDETLNYEYIVEKGDFKL